MVGFASASIVGGGWWGCGDGYSMEVVAAGGDGLAVAIGQSDGERCASLCGAAGGRGASPARRRRQGGRSNSQRWMNHNARDGDIPRSEQQRCNHAQL